MLPPYRIAPNEPLGALVREHRWVATKQLIVLSVIFILPLLMLPFVLREDFRTWEWGAFLGAAIFLVGMPAFGIATLIRARRMARDVVGIHVDGFYYRGGDRREIVRWEDVASIDSNEVQRVVNGMAGPVLHDHKIFLRDGRNEIRLTHGFEKVGELIAEVRRHMAPP